MHYNDFSRFGRALPGVPTDSPQILEFDKDAFRARLGPKVFMKTAIQPEEKISPTTMENIQIPGQAYMPPQVAATYVPIPWLDQTMILGIKNKWLLAGVGGTVLLLGIGGIALTRKKKPSMSGYGRRYYNPKKRK